MNSNRNWTLAAMVIIALSTSCLAAQSKEAMTITDRQTSLMETVASAEKSGELTYKEANSFRKSEGKIVAKIVKMKSKNDGKLSYNNINEIERKLNKMSNKLHKLQLEKRVSD